MLLIALITQKCIFAIMCNEEITALFSVLDRPGLSDNVNLDRTRILHS